MGTELLHQRARVADELYARRNRDDITNQDDYLDNAGHILQLESELATLDETIASNAGQLYYLLALETYRNARHDQESREQARVYIVNAVWHALPADHPYQYGDLALFIDHTTPAPTPAGTADQYMRARGAA